VAAVADKPAGPLAGVRVLELGTMLAGPFTARLLGEFGAEVIKVEPPTGDPLRGWRLLDESGTSVWWYVQSRNKKCVTLDLRKPRGQELARRLAAVSDVAIENFKPGTLERWGLGYDALRALNPRLVLVRISGYGQTGPEREKPGFGAIGEAMGGLRYVTGYPDRPPPRVGISLGDAVAALHAALGAVMALYRRDAGGSGAGQVVDVALYEAVFNLMEGLVPEYDKFGFVRERSGSALPGIAPSNTYPCSDEKYVVIGANSDSLYVRLMETVERPDLAADPELQANAGRVRRIDEIDGAIGAWTRQRPLAAVVRAMEAAGIPVGPIYSAAEIVADPQYQARGMIETVEVPGLGPLRIPGVVPRLSDTPGGTRWPGPPLGAHNAEVYGDLLGLDAAELAALRADGVI
jgi:crotonobetainyl-CoA:carnitine CoA-transferase CaiB-like acyl-CoA transferase